MTTTTTTTTAPDYYVPAALDAFNLDAVPERYRATLAGLIPAPETGPTTDGVSGYIPRTLDGESDMTVFGKAMDARFHVVLNGPTGSAKTSAARAFAALHGLPFYSIAVNGGIDPSAVWGRWIIDANGALEWVPSNAALVAEYGGVLVLDEYNMAHPRIMAAFHELLDVRRSVTVPENNGAVIPVSDALLIVATANPGYAGTADTNQALNRRFAWPFVWGYSPEVEAVLVPSPTLREFAADVRESPDVRTDLSTDTLVVFIDTAAMTSPEFAAARLVDAFKPSEREGVRRALELRLPTIASELSDLA